MMGKERRLMKQRAIYTNGDWQVVPIVHMLCIQGRDGRKIQTLRIEEVEEAIKTVDELASLDGVFQHVSM